MKTERIRLLSLDVVQLDLTRNKVRLAYAIRTPVGDNHGDAEIALDAPAAMIEAVLEAARAKAALLSEVFSGRKTSSDHYQIADYRVTCDRIAPLVARVAAAAARHGLTPLSPEERTALETDGVHLLRAELDPEGKADDARAEILRRKAELCLDGADPAAARLHIERALKLRPDDPALHQLAERCGPAA